MILARTRDFLELIKFSHTLFALPFALLGAALAAYAPGTPSPRLQDWLGILLCMATARSAAMAFNRLADRSYDALNPRTAGRHLPAGRLSVRSVAVFTARRRRGLHRLDAPVPAEPMAARTCRSRSCSGCWVIPTPSDSPAWPISGWGSRSAWRRSPPGSPSAATCTGRRSSWPRPSCSGSPGSTSSTPARTSTSTSRPASAASRGRFGVRERPPDRRRLPCPDDRPPGRARRHLPPRDRSTSSGVAAVAVLLVYEHALVRPDDLSRVNVAFFQVNIVISMGLLVGRRHRPAAIRHGPAAVDDSFNSD